MLGSHTIPWQGAVQKRKMLCGKIRKSVPPCLVTRVVTGKAGTGDIAGVLHRRLVRACKNRSRPIRACVQMVRSVEPLIRR